MTYQNNKISELIEGQLPNFLQEDGPKFVKFVEKYYEFMESSKLEVSTTGVLSLDFSKDVKIKTTRKINDSQDVKHVYAKVLNSYPLDNGNYVFYIKENNEKIQILNITSDVGSINIGDTVTQSIGETIVTGTVLHVSIFEDEINKILVLNNNTGVFIQTTELNPYELEFGVSSVSIQSIEKPESESTRGFIPGDEISIISGDDGSTGNLTVVSYIQNVTLSSKNLMNLQDIDKTLDDYVDYFMKEYMEGYPLSFPNEYQSSDIDVPEFKKFLVKHSREFYQSKGTEDSFKYFFRTIFNDSVTIRYPKEEILKPSDNTFSRSKTILLNPSLLSVPDIESQKIVGQSSGVSAYVEKILGVTVGEYSLFQIELNEYGLSGVFLQGENIVLESDPSTIIGTINFGVSEISLYDVEESFELEEIFYIDRSGRIVNYQEIQDIDKGSIIELSVCDINAGRISEIEVVNGGLGYSFGDKLTFDNTNCFTQIGPSRPIEAVVSKVDDDGKILEIKVLCDGKGYIKYPTIKKIGDTDVTSESFNLIGKDVGTLKQVRIRKNGIGYTRNKIEHYLEDWTSPTESTLVLKKTEIGVELPYLTLTIQNQSDDFTVGEIVNHQTLDGTGKVVSWESQNEIDSETQEEIIKGVLVLREYSGVFSSAGEDIIQGVDSNVTGTVGVASYDSTKFKVGNGSDVWSDLEYDSGTWNDSILVQPYSIDIDLNSSGSDDLRLSLGSIFDDGGRFLNNNSFLSDIKYIQDSFYYQTYSYVLETSLMVKNYRDLLKRLIHPAGMQMFGKITSQSKKEVKMSLSDIKTKISIVIWDYIGKHSDKLIRDFDFLYSLLILDGDDSAPFNLELQVSDTVDLTDETLGFEVDNIVYGFVELENGDVTVKRELRTDSDGYAYFASVVDGDGTQFLVDLQVGDVINLPDPKGKNRIFHIQSIESNTKLILSESYNPHGTADEGWSLPFSTTLQKSTGIGKVDSWDFSQTLILKDIVGEFNIDSIIYQGEFGQGVYPKYISSTIQNVSKLSLIEQEINDSRGSKELIPNIYYHGSYACDYLYNENTYQNHRYKIKYKNLRPGTPKRNDFYKWNELSGTTVSIPDNSYTITGYGINFTSLRLFILDSSGVFNVGEIVNNHKIESGTGESEPISGTVSIKSGTRIVTGDGTKFLVDLQVGDVINLPDPNGKNRIFHIQSIESNTELTLLEYYPYDSWSSPFTTYLYKSIGTGEVVSWNSQTGELILTNYTGTFIGGGTDIIIGPNLNVTGTISSVLSLNEGDVIAINGQQFSIVNITNDSELTVNTCSEEEVLETQLLKRVLI